MALQKQRFFDGGIQPSQPRVLLRRSRPRAVASKSFFSQLLTDYEPIWIKFDADASIHNYAFMRTTLDIPDSIGRRVKIAAARRGLSMKALIVTALENELDMRKHAAQARPLRFPLISSKTPGCYDLKPEEINAILVREEVAAYEAAERR